ncbi:MAG: hypothetical protein HQL01_13355 [Nitrospirae bacterium]|nr:hypothetical protein [Nitrospirota bacterium]
MGSCCGMKKQKDESKHKITNPASGDCCETGDKGTKTALASTYQPTAATEAPHGVHSTSGRQLKEVAGVTLAEVALAAGILVFLPVVLNKIAPGALKYVKDGFELASRSMK